MCGEGQTSRRTIHLTPLNITTEHALTVAGLPRYHQDPFDRLLVAQAQVEKLTLVTGDIRIQQYAVRVIAT
jgi:PIN domain nuclease of toxin-antitoxin system